MTPDYVSSATVGAATDRAPSDAGALDQLLGPGHGPLLDGAGGESDLVGDPERAGGAVADDRDAAEAEQDRAPGRIRVHLRPQAAERRAQEQPARRRHRPGPGGAPDRIGDGAGGALERLQDDVAGEPVGDDDVDLGIEELAALDVAGEADPRRAGER